VILAVSHQFKQSEVVIKIPTTETRQVLTIFTISGPAIPENLQAFRLNINNKKIESSMSVVQKKNKLAVVGMAV